MNYFVEFVCIAAELWFTHLILESFLTKKDLSKPFIMLSYLCAGAALTAITFFIENAFARLFASGVLIFSLATLLYGKNILRALTCVLINCTIVALSDILVSFLFILIGFNSEILLGDNTIRLLYMAAGHIIMFGLAACIWLTGRKNNEISIRIFLPLLPCWLMSLLLCIALAWDFMVMGRSVPMIYVFVILGMLYTDIIIMFFQKRLADEEHERMQRTISEHHFIMQQEYYDQFKIQQDETWALWHDISKLIGAAKLENSSEANAQIEQMLASVPCVADFGNRIVSIILNEYIQIARSNKIVLDLNVNVPSTLFVTTVDLYIILGNTLDNAIKACLSLPESDREIHLKLRTHNEMLYYEISNAYCEDDKPVARKGHGYGLKNVEKSVKRYDGIMEVTKENGIFKVSVCVNNI